jgi:hypothetical protein
MSRNRLDLRHTLLNAPMQPAQARLLQAVLTAAVAATAGDLSAPRAAKNPPRRVDGQEAFATRISFGTLSRKPKAQRNSLRQTVADRRAWDCMVRCILTMQRDLLF